MRILGLLKSIHLINKKEYFRKNKILKNIKDNNKYIICPKVRLEVFIEVTNKQELF